MVGAAGFAPPASRRRRGRGRRGGAVRALGRILGGHVGPSRGLGAGSRRGLGRWPRGGRCGRCRALISERLNILLPLALADPAPDSVTSPGRDRPRRLARAVHVGAGAGLVLDGRPFHLRGFARHGCCRRRARAGGLVRRVPLAIPTWRHGEKLAGGGGSVHQAGRGMMRRSGVTRSERCHM
jgi:hypothetical protein